MQNVISIIASCLLLACVQEISTNEYSKELLQEKMDIETSDYEKLVAQINSCITQASKNVLIQRQKRDDSDCKQSEKRDGIKCKPYCADLTTTLEHRITRRCRYMVFERLVLGDTVATCLRVLRNIDKPKIEREVSSKCNHIKKHYEDELNNKDKRAEIRHLLEQIPKEICDI